MIKPAGVLLLVFLVACAASSADAKTYFGVLTTPPNSGPGGSCCSTVTDLDDDNAAVPTDGSCVGCVVITAAQYQDYLTAATKPPKTRTTTARAVASGITLTCSATPSLSGTYSVDNNMMTELLVIVGVTNGNSFPASLRAITVQDTLGGLHTFPSAKAFNDFYSVVALYWVQLLDAQQRILAGQSVSFPVATSTAC